MYSARAEVGDQTRVSRIPAVGEPNRQSMK